MKRQSAPTKRSQPKPKPEPKSEPNPKAVVPISVSILPEHLRDLDELAHKNGSSRSGLVKIAIARLLRDGI